MHAMVRSLCALLATPLAIASSSPLGAEAADRVTVESALAIQLYGFIKLDAARDSDQVAPGNYVKWVDLDPLNRDDEQFSMTVNETRLGVRIMDPEDNGSLKLSGRIEVDFYGAAAAENKAEPMLRHAYVELDWPASGWSLLAGQTSDVISPLSPKSLNYSVAWWAGNIGYRRPQLCLTKAAGSDAAELRWSLALTRDIGAASSSFTGIDAGADSGVPGLQTRLGWVWKRRQGEPIAFGVSGHWAREDFHFNAEGDHQDFDSWSANLDLRWPLGDRLALAAELFTGADLAVYLGGVGQGLNRQTLEEVEFGGGWLSLEIGPFDRWSYHLGVAVDDPHNDTLSDGDRSRNGSLFANGRFALRRHLELALELSYWETTYLEAGTADAGRVQFAVFYRF